ncbi:MAG: 3-isopropylmalate dehydrogenase [Gammaproteobacteria bacterium]|jgi:3-isopropylmalate dehydrogenase
MPGDGIGKEITAPPVERVKEAAHQCAVELGFFDIEAGAQYFLDTGNGFLEEHFVQAASADAIYLAAMDLPDIRYPDGTEVGPQRD